MRRYSDPRAGQMIIFATGTLFFLFTVLGLAVDLGFSYSARQQAQSAADAASTGAMQYAVNGGYTTCGTSHLACGSAYTCPSTLTSATTVQQSGCMYARANLNGTGQTVTVLANNTAVPNESTVSSNLWIQATVSQSIPLLFLHWAGSKGPTATTSTNVVAQSISGLSTITTGSAAATIFALGSGITSYIETGSGNITAAGITVNGNFSDSGSNSIHTTQLNVVGNMSVSGSTSITATTGIKYGGTYNKSGSGTVSPAPVHGTVTAVADPFATIPPPTFNASSCDYTNAHVSGSGTTNLSPGVYCGGIQISGSGTVNFASGTYVLYGGGMNYSGSGDLDGSGVMFYNTGDTSSTATYKISPVSMSGSGSMNLSAASSGTYQGLLVFQDRTQTYSTANTVSGSGNISTGTFYFPTTELDYTGSATAHYQALVANVIKLSGSANLPADLTGTYTGFVQTRNVVAMLQ